MRNDDRGGGAARPAAAPQQARLCRDHRERDKGAVSAEIVLRRTCGIVIITSPAPQGGALLS